MKYASYRKDGENGFGAAVGDGVVALKGKIGGAASLAELLEQDGLAEAAGYASGRAPDIALSEIAFLPVIPQPSKVICVGLNYLAHAKEADRGIGEHPVIFHRFADSLIGHREALLRPRVSERHDYEGELAVIIGKGGRHIPPERAMEHVAGYACFNDSSIRDWQFHTGQYGMGKNFLATGGFGPWMVTADEIPDWRALTLETWLNGERMQQGALKDLAFDIPSLIAYVSKALPWRPGDILVTGTPSGVGFARKPPIFLKPGDKVEVRIPGVGVLENPVRSED